ncbi:MAG TPA: response regulator [Myxococcaceae bacterium]|jgi:CheY-like chemotaxis protein
MTRLLVVDDELSILEALQDILSLEGYEVVTAYNGVEGLRRIGEQRPDLVLLDLMMPVMDGREMLRRVRENPALRDLPVVVMSAGRIADAERRAASATLAKPFDLDHLLQTLAQQLRPKRRSDA